jgi:hypothetical protein
MFYMTLGLSFNEAINSIVCYDYGGNENDFMFHVVEISSAFLIVLNGSIGVLKVIFPLT